MALLVALLEAPSSVPEFPQITGWAQVGAWVVGITTTILTAKHIAENAKQAAENADNKAQVAHDRVDNEEKLRHAVELELITTRTRLSIVEAEVLRLRDERHNERNWLSGKLGIIEHEVDVLKDKTG